MNPDDMLHSVLILRSTKAVIFQMATQVHYMTRLKKGHRFPMICGIEEKGEVTVLIEAATGTMWGIPTDAVFPLTGRFTPRG